MSISVITATAQDGSMNRKKGPRQDGPRARRSFTPAQKLELLSRYEQALTTGEGGAFLRREGLYSSSREYLCSKSQHGTSHPTGLPRP